MIAGFIGEKHFIYIKLIKNVLIIFLKKHSVLSDM
jgi:hypothetical protein